MKMDFITFNTLQVAAACIISQPVVIFSQSAPRQSFIPLDIYVNKGPVVKYHYLRRPQAKLLI